MRKALCVILIFAICSFYMYAYAEDTTDLQAQADELQSQIEEATEELNEIDSQLSENLQQVQKLDQTISEAEADLEELNAKIEELNLSIEETEAKLTDVQARYDEQKSLLDARLVAIYEAGDIQYLDVILSSASIGEFISNYYLITELAQYDSDLLEVVEEEKNTIEETKEALDKAKDELVSTKQTQLKTAKVLENTRTVREYYIARLSEEEKEIQDKIDEFKAQYAAIEAEIQQIAQSSVSEEYIGGVMAWPVPGYTTITSKYGMRTHPITGVYKLHSGVDISAPTGTNFVAAADGVVTKAEYNTAYGNMVMIDHGGGISTLYAHGSEIMVEVGQVVQQNDVVLKVGQTGYATGAHAHFEVRINGTTVDPLPYITTSTTVTDDTDSVDDDGFTLD